VELRTLLLLSCAATFAVASPYQGHLGLDSHFYSGPREAEPTSQLIPQAVLDVSEPGREVRLHFEMETRGQRDLSLDLDRAWIEFPVFGSDALALGRQHPWDHSEFSEKDRPWGILGHTQPQNLGINLGYGLNSDSREAQPILLGWLGANYWSDRADKSWFAFGASFTPLFVPTLGSSVSLGFDRTTTTRFGRRPPGYVAIDDTVVPLRFEVDRSRVWEDVLLHPQILLQARLRPTPELSTWIGYLRAPDPDPKIDSTEYLNVAGDTIVAQAAIRPRFPQRQLVFVAQEWQLSAVKVFGTAFATDDSKAGGELGLKFPFLSLSLGHEVTWKDLDPDFAYRPPLYGAWLAQTELRVPFGDFWTYFGWKHHLHLGDRWLQAGIGWGVTSHLTLDLRGDIFAGSDQSYFGEWRTNDRVGLLMRWELGT